jgi:hypothetical protein
MRLFIIEAFTSETLEVYSILSRIRLFVIEAFTSEALEVYCILSRIRLFVIEAFTSETLEVYCILSRIRLFVVEAFTSEALEVYCILSRIRLFVVEAFIPGTLEVYFHFEYKIVSYFYFLVYFVYDYIICMLPMVHSHSALVWPNMSLYDDVYIVFDALSFSTINDVFVRGMLYFCGFWWGLCC